jgi:hypothetical protein
VRRTAALLNPNNPNFDAQVEELRQAQRAAARQLTILQAGTSAEIDAAFQAWSPSAQPHFSFALPSRVMNSRRFS